MVYKNTESKIFYQDRGVAQRSNHTVLDSNRGDSTWSLHGRQRGRQAPPWKSSQKYHSPKRHTSVVLFKRKATVAPQNLAPLHCKFVLCVITTTSTRFGRRFIRSIEFVAVAASIRLQAVIVVGHRRRSPPSVAVVVLASVLYILHSSCYYY